MSDFEGIPPEIVRKANHLSQLYGDSYISENKDGTYDIYYNDGEGLIKNE